MHFTRAQSKADEPSYHLKVFIRYLFGICLKILAKQDIKQVVPPEIGTLILRTGDPLPIINQSWDNVWTSIPVSGGDNFFKRIWKGKPL